MTKVLVVDDDRDIVELLTTLITTALGYDVIGFSDPREALKAVTDPTIDAIISDERMPQMSGLQFLKAAQDLGYCGHMFVFSGFVDDSTSFRLLNIEIRNGTLKSKFAAVSKPESNKLLAALKEAIDDQFTFEEVGLW